MKKIYYLIILLFIIDACKRDCTNSTDPIQTLPKDEFNLLFPYSGLQKLKFLKNKIDTITFNKSDLITSYSYTTTQADCPVAIPLEQKYFTFVDSVEGNSFILFNYVNASFSNNFRIIINNQTIADGSTGDFIRPYPPINKIKILNYNYDTISTWYNHSNDTVVFKAKRYGVLKFNINKNVFELIPQ
jgi:hypothetical protein